MEGAAMKIDCKRALQKFAVYYRMVLSLSLFHLGSYKLHTFKGTDHWLQNVISRSTKVNVNTHTLILMRKHTKGAITTAEQWRTK